MPLNRLPTRALLLLATVAAYAQEASTPAPVTPHPGLHTSRSEPTFNPTVIVLDPAHGGADNGAHFADGVFEKDVTAAFAGRLKTLLASRGFTVVLTHEAATDELSLDQRVEIANRNRPLACLLLHAASGGHGIHLYTSSLPPAPPATDIPESYRPLIPWDTAQAAALEQSVGLKADLSAAILGIRIPLVAGQASVRPIDSMNCPAVALEIAPLDAGAGATTPVTDGDYQQRVAEALAGALVNWRDHAVAEAAAADAARAAEAERQADDSSGKPPEITAHPRPKPRPSIPATSFPDEAASSAPTTKKPAPVVRQPPRGGKPQ